MARLTRLRTAIVLLLRHDRAGALVVGRLGRRRRLLDDRRGGEFGLKGGTIGSATVGCDARSPPTALNGTVGSLLQRGRSPGAVMGRT